MVWRASRRRINHPGFGKQYFVKIGLSASLVRSASPPEHDGILIVLIDLQQEIKRMLYDRAIALKRYPATLLVENNQIRSDLFK